MTLWTGERASLSDIEEEEGPGRREIERGGGVDGEWRSHEGGRETETKKRGGEYSCGSEEGKDEERGGSRVRKEEGGGEEGRGGKEGEK